MACEFYVKETIKKKKKDIETLEQEGGNMTNGPSHFKVYTDVRSG